MSTKIKKILLELLKWTAEGAAIGVIVYVIINVLGW